MRLRIRASRRAEARRNWQRRSTAGQQLVKTGVVTPGGQCARFEAVGQLLVGHNRLFGFVGAHADGG